MTRDQGYSLIELLAVLAVMSVLAMAAAPVAEIAAQRQKERALREALWEIRSAIDAYKRAVDSGQVARLPGGSGYPPTLAVLTNGISDRDGRTLYLLRRMPRDPFAAPTLPADQTWRIRSYDSPPESPTTGADVYDVQSRSDRIGLDGTALKEW